MNNIDMIVRLCSVIVYGKKKKKGANSSQFSFYVIDSILFLV